MSRLICFALVAGLSGCAVWSPDDTAEEAERDGRVRPIDAMRETEEPRRDMPGPEDPDGLSRDIERLQDARRKYENERDFEAAERRRRQAECREMEGSREVPIEDGSGDPATFCIPPDK